MVRSTRLFLFGRIEVRILSHFPLHLLALLLVMQKDTAIAEVFPLDFALGAAEQGGVLVHITAFGTDLGHLLCG